MSSLSPSPYLFPLSLSNRSHARTSSPSPRRRRQHLATFCHAGPQARLPARTTARPVTPQRVQHKHDEPSPDHPNSLHPASLLSRVPGVANDVWRRFFAHAIYAGRTGSQPAQQRALQRLNTCKTNATNSERTTGTVCIPLLRLLLSPRRCRQCLAALWMPVRGMSPQTRATLCRSTVARTLPLIPSPRRHKRQVATF
jgi:hypothetical protein